MTLYKTCTKCKEYKHISLFYKYTNSENYRACCKNCCIHLKIITPETRERTNNRLRAFRKNNPKEAWRKYLRNKSSITPEEYDALLLKQNGRCKICDKKPSKVKLAVDHDHDCCNGQRSCGRCVRGLLCRRCNMGIGIFYDDSNLIESAVAYVKEWEDKQTMISCSQCGYTVRVAKKWLDRGLPSCPCNGSKFQADAVEE